MIKVWRHWIIRPNAPLLLAPFALVSVILLQLSWEKHPFSLPAVIGQNLVLLTLFLVPLLWLCRRRAKRALMGRSYAAFILEIVRAQGLGLLTALGMIW